MLHMHGRLIKGDHKKSSDNKQTHIGAAVTITTTTKLTTKITRATANTMRSPTTAGMTTTTTTTTTTTNKRGKTLITKITTHYIK